MIQEELPDQKMTGPIGDFVRKMYSKVYSVPFVSDPWSRVRPREIRFFDFTIPSAIEKEVLQSLTPFLGGKIGKLSQITQVPILKGLIEKTLGIKAIDMDPYLKIQSDPQARQPKDVGVRIAILGKLEDEWQDGVEMI